MGAVVGAGRGATCGAVGRGAGGRVSARAISTGLGGGAGGGLAGGRAGAGLAAAWAKIRPAVQQDSRNPRLDLIFRLSGPGGPASSCYYDITGSNGFSGEGVPGGA